MIFKVPNKEKCSDIEQLRAHCQTEILFNDRPDEHKLILSLIDKLDKIKELCEEDFKTDGIEIDRCFGKPITIIKIKSIIGEGISNEE
jgi:hypothetical protein